MLLNLFIDSISATRGNCTSIEENNDNIWLMSMADYVSLAVWYLQWYLDAFQRLLLYDTMIFTLCAQYNGSIHIPLVQNAVRKSMWHAIGEEGVVEDEFRDVG